MLKIFDFLKAYKDAFVVLFGFVTGAWFLFDHVQSQKSATLNTQSTSVDNATSDEEHDAKGKYDKQIEDFIQKAMHTNRNSSRIINKATKVSVVYLNTQDVRTKSIEKEGIFEITDIQVENDKTNHRWKLDIRVLNNRDDTVQISRALIEVLDLKRVVNPSRAVLPSSAGYFVDVTSLNSMGDVKDISVSHQLKSGEADRFEIYLGVKGEMANRYSVELKLRLSLVTSVGVLEGVDFLIKYFE